MTKNTKHIIRNYANALNIWEKDVILYRKAFEREIKKIPCNITKNANLDMLDAIQKHSFKKVLKAANRIADTNFDLYMYICKKDITYKHIENAWNCKI